MTKAFVLMSGISMLIRKRFRLCLSVVLIVLLFPFLTFPQNTWLTPRVEFGSKELPRIKDDIYYLLEDFNSQHYSTVDQDIANVAFYQTAHIMTLLDNTADLILLSENARLLVEKAREKKVPQELFLANVQLVDVGVKWRIDKNLSLLRTLADTISSPYVKSPHLFNAINQIKTKTQYAIKEIEKYSK